MLAVRIGSTEGYGAACPLGITTATFGPAIQRGECTVEEVIRWASDQGFGWIEVRDSLLRMTREQLKSIRRAGDLGGLALHYAWDCTDLLNADYGALRVGCRNASVLNDHPVCRIVIAPEHIRSVPGTKGYSSDQIDQIAKAVPGYVAKARAAGARLAFENSFEPICGDGATYAGMTDLLDSCPSMRTTFDPGNFANRAQTCANPNEQGLMDYVDRYGDRIDYCHLKLTQGNELLPAIDRDGDYRIGELLKRMPPDAARLICLEIPGQPSLADTRAGIQASVGYLLRSGVLFDV